MAGFDSGVNPPSPASYNAPLVNFSQLANLPNAYYQGIFNQQQQGLNDETSQLRQQQIAEAKRQADLAKVFQGGIPRDSQGNPDYGKIAAMLAEKGDIGALTQLSPLIQQQQAANTPLYGGTPGPAGGGGQALQAGAQPMSVPANPLPPPSASAPKGDSGQGTITDLVTEKLPSQNQTTGQTIMKIAQVMGVDPNADLTPGQQVRAQGLLKKYAPDIAGSGALSFSDRFASDGAMPGGSKLPPSANAVSPAPTAGSTGGGTAGRTGAPQPAGGAPVPAQPPGTGGAGAGPAPQGPIVPQPPLPPGFTDPMQAINALRDRAARLEAANPRAKPIADRLRDQATQIENSMTPLSVGAQTTLVDPRTGRTLYQGPGAAAYGSGSGETGQTLDADANQYRLTGKLPPNMGRGVQGQQQATLIRTRAAEQEIAEGGDVNDWPARWQKFGTQAAGLRSLEVRAAGLTLAENESKRLIPRVRDISDKISRTDYPSINSLILAAKKGVGDPNVIKLGIAVESLVPVYARVLKPTGTVGAADMERAHDILDKAWSKGQINAALDQMEVELDSAKSALKDTQQEYGSGGGKKKEESAGATSSSKKTTNTTPNGLSWSVE